MDAVITSAATTGAVVGVNAATSVAISAIGFSQAGVVAGTVAAGVQSGIGAVAAGSLFASLQSLGALGLGILGTAAMPVAVVTGLVAGGAKLFMGWKK
jgi:hypothetical protein